MRKRSLILLVVLSLLCLPVLLMAKTPTLSNPAPGKVPVKFVPQRAAVILWDQPISGSYTNAYGSQDFDEANNAYDIFGADDFLVDAPWFVEVIYTPGDLWNGGSTVMNATALNWQIYADAGGVPDGDPWGNGNSPFWSLSLAPTDPQVSVTNGGTTWIPIKTLSGNPGSYEWTVPTLNAEKTKCKVKVVLLDGVGNPIGTDVSDDIFTISPYMPPP